MYIIKTILRIHNAFAKYELLAIQQLRDMQSVPPFKHPLL